MKRNPAELRVAVLADFTEEGWPSMDLVAEMLVAHLPAAWGKADGTVQLLRPALQRRLSKLPLGGRAGVAAWSFDRLANRFFDYPRFAQSQRNRFDLFHLADHSYSQLVHELPAGRTIVTCHDADTFRCLWEPDHGGRGPVFRAMTRRILAGLQNAAHVCCDSQATCDDLLGRQLLAPERVSVVPLGLRPELLQPADPAAEAAVEAMLAAGAEGSIDLLHVGSCIPRKRIDVLLEVFAQLRRTEPRLRLLRVGGAFTPEQQRQAERLGILGRIRVLPFLSVAELAAVYRRSALALLPSEAEGFGFPVIEAMACGTPVLASDLPVLREAGRTAASYAPVAKVEAWANAAQVLLQEREARPEAWRRRRETGREQGRIFTWADTAKRICTVYDKILANFGT